MIGNYFEDYRAAREAEARGRRPHEGDTCEQCGKRARRLTRDGYCDICLRYSWGYDQAQERTTLSLLGGAVKGALEAYVDPALIRQAVDEAIDQHQDEETAAIATLLAKAAA